MEKAIVHYDLDSFFISCERLTNDKLKDIPLIIGGSKNRGVVSSCSYEARKYGVRSAMPVSYALKLCPDAKVLKGDFDLYSRKSREVTEIMKEVSPVIEKASIDEFYIDASGMDRFFGTYQWSEELSSRITHQTGLPISFGLSVNKCVAKMATNEGKPIGKMHVPEQSVRPFLNPLPINKIPGLGPANYKILSRIGIRHIRTLADMPIDLVENLIGKNGIMLWKKANGIDPSPIIPYSERKSIGKEMTFNSDTMEIDTIKAIIVSMVEGLSFQLRQDKKLTSCISVRIRYTNFDTHSKQKQIAYTASDDTLIRTALSLFDKLYTRRMRLRMVGVKFSGLVNGQYQISLYDDTTEKISLYQAMDKIRSKYGERSVQRGSTVELFDR